VSDLDFEQCVILESTAAKRQKARISCWRIGGRDRDRTGDPLLARQAEIQA